MRRFRMFLLIPILGMGLFGGKVGAVPSIDSYNISTTPVTIPPTIQYEMWGLSNDEPDELEIEFTVSGFIDADNPSYDTTLTIFDTLTDTSIITIKYKVYTPSFSSTVYWDGSWNGIGRIIIGGIAGYKITTTEKECDIKHNGGYKIRLNVKDKDDEITWDQLAYVDVIHIQGNVKHIYEELGKYPPAKILPYRYEYQLTKDSYVTIKVYDWRDEDGNGEGDWGEDKDGNGILDWTEDTDLKKRKDAALVATIVEDVARYGEGKSRDVRNTDLWDGKATEDIILKRDLDNDGTEEYVEVKAGQLVPQGVYWVEIIATEFPNAPIPDPPPGNLSRTDIDIWTHTVAIDPLRLIDIETTKVTNKSYADIRYKITKEANVKIGIYRPGTKFKIERGQVKLYQPDEAPEELEGLPIPTEDTDEDGETKDDLGTEKEEVIVRVMVFSREKGEHTEIWDGRDRDNKLLPNGDYIFSITAIDSHGVKAFDRFDNNCPFIGKITVQVEIEGNKAPHPPTSGFSPANEETIDDLTPKIDWDAASDEDPYDSPASLHYIIHLYSAKGGSLENPLRKYTTVSGRTEQVIPDVEKLDDETMWYYAIKTVDRQGYESVWSELQNFYIDHNDPPYAPTSGFSPSGGETVGDKTPVIKWDAATDKDISDPASTLHYVIRLDDDGEIENNYKYEYTTKDGYTQVQITDVLTDETMWYYAVKTVDDGGAESNWSVIQSFYVDYNSPPNPPLSGFSPSRGERTLDQTPTVSWGAGYDPDKEDTQDTLHYILQVDDDRDFRSPFEYTTPDGVTQYKVTDTLKDKTTYYYRVKTVDRHGLESPGWSPVQEFIVDTSAKPPQQKPTLSLTPGDTKISLYWDKVTNAKGYYIYYDNDKSGEPYEGKGATEGDSPIKVEGGDKTSFILSGLRNDKTYYIVVSAYNDDGEGPKSDEKSTTPKAAIEEKVFKKENVYCYPNPAKGERVNITWPPIEGKVTIKIYTLSGDEVWSKDIKDGRTTIEIPWDAPADNIGSGVYIVRIRHETGGTITKKMVYIK
ncbi:MAG: T9SS type A sorting domain-containing protein [bacterium]|nr:T9SS type A sorting domain-containing protein [bacterium]